MPIEILRKYLDENDVRYVVLDHSRAFTAQEVAASAHVPGKELAKTVMVRIDEDLAMAVLPASYKVDFELLREAAGAARVELAEEAEFSGLFPDCEIGAMPPFGNLYGMKVYVAESLAEDEEIVFNGCSHTQLVRMAYADFERLVKPTVLRFSTRMV
jgi:Ala-tRNA(Pro) deacylase